jgi:antitoxin PrlF
MARRDQRVRSDATVTSKGQITLPAALRRELGIQTGDRVRFERSGERVVMRPLPRGDLMALAGAFAGRAARSASADLATLRRDAWRKRGKRLGGRRAR